MRERNMAYDLVIKNGSIVDGSGNPQYRADVAVQDGKIAAIGRVKWCSVLACCEALVHHAVPRVIRHASQRTCSSTG